MALRRIECPHCEKVVEVDVTHVTRSRDCPNCGKSIMLQFTTTQKRTKRTALMVPSVDAVESLGEVPHADHALSKPLEGEAHNRLMHDPEVRQNLKHLVWGAAILAATILLLFAINYLQGGKESGKTSSSSQPNVPTKETSSSLLPPQKNPAAPSPPPSPPSTPVGNTAPASARPDTPGSSATPVIVASSPGPIEEQRALRVLEAFLKARNVAERLPLVRDLQTMEPTIRAYYTRYPDGPIPFTKITPEPITPGIHPIRRFEVHLTDGSKRLATTGRATSGDFRVDWASFVIYSAMSWDNFASQQPEEPVFMRVLAQQGDHYEGAFAGKEEFLCVKLTDPLNPGGTPLYGYVSRKSGAGQTLHMVFRYSGSDPIPMMFKLKHPPQPEGGSRGKSQVLIDQFLGEGWVISGS